MTASLFDHMQQAVDIVGTSPHPTNKIAATLAGDGFALSYTNQWPKLIAERIGTATRIGNSSGTVHAETMCLLHAPKTEGAALFVTDPPCPNCVKYMAEAGVKSLYIDHKGFDKDFARRRGDDFANMSMKICQHAGISVYELRRKEEKLVPIWEAPDNYEPPEENPVLIKRGHIESMCPRYTKETPFATALTRTADGTLNHITATVHPAIGYTSETLEEPEDKYSFLLQPVSRILMSAARHGLTIEPGSLYASRTPTARELVNLLGAGLTTITIGDPTKSRDEFGPMALAQLVGAGILEVKNI